MSFLFCLKAKNSIDDIFTNTKCYRPIKRTRKKLRVLFVFDKLLSLKKLGYNTLVNLFKGEI